MKKHLSTFLLLALFLIGFSLLLYPVVSNYINSKTQSQAIAAYQEGAKQYTKEDYTEFFDKARAYNEKLAKNNDRYYLSDADSQEYASLLNPFENGMMGYIEIPTIAVNLPVYHGISDPVLRAGVGHMPGTSLPVGGEGTHCVLSGHRGLPSSKLFTDLDKLKEGDLFVLHVLDQVLAYQVDRILTVQPMDTSMLAIRPKQDICTLITCTPYGVNTERLLVSGHRVDYQQAITSDAYISAGATEIDSIFVLPFIAVPLLLALLAALLVKTRMWSR